MWYLLDKHLSYGLKNMVKYLYFRLIYEQNRDDGSRGAVLMTSFSLMYIYNTSKITLCHKKLWLICKFYRFLLVISCENIQYYKNLLFHCNSFLLLLLHQNLWWWNTHLSICKTFCLSLVRYGHLKNSYFYQISPILHSVLMQKNCNNMRNNGSYSTLLVPFWSLFIWRI